MGWKMKIQLVLNADENEYLEGLKSKHDELVVPLQLWVEHIENNARISKEDFPQNLKISEYVITERDWFCYVINKTKYLHHEKERLSKEQGGVWLTTKLEPKKKMPKHDIFDSGKRQQGSFGSGS